MTGLPPIVVGHNHPTRGMQAELQLTIDALSGKYGAT